MGLILLIRRLVYVMAFLLSAYALRAFDFERFLKKNHVQQAQVLYWLLVVALAYLCASFVLQLI